MPFAHHVPVRADELAIRAPGRIKEDGHVRCPFLQMIQQLFRRKRNDGLLPPLCFSLWDGGCGSGCAVARNSEEAEEAEEAEEEGKAEGGKG